jgi:malonyl-CoA/methylmalonyl-CoA synthetase
MQAIEQAPILDQMMGYRDSLAITDSRGEYTYREILLGAHGVATCLLGGHSDLAEQRVAILAAPGYDYTVSLLGVWAAGGIAVPLCIQHPPAEMQYVLDDTKAKYLIVSTEFEDLVLNLNIKPEQRVLRFSDAVKTKSKPLPDVTVDRRAMILYTSGTTSRPKGVVTTHKNISAQIKSLIDAWGWSSNDRIPLFLPLHHVHGIINVLCCSLWAGATCDVLPKFDAEDVWDRVVGGKLTLLMAVPTIYVKLIAAWKDMVDERRKECSKTASKFRLMVSGSAALPVSVLETWETITGHTLLERYGMTEIGMALSNPLKGERRPGFVGMPLPGMTAMLADEKGTQIAEEGVQGEICVHGDTVFNEYWERDEATEKSFRNGWFLTGDIAVIDKGSYRILGRNSVDIIKSGGYKISALEIEEVLRTHPEILECAVVGIADEEWGERVSAGIVSAGDKTVELSELKDWAGDKLAKYKIPSQILALDELPRNVMGKVTKKAVQKLFEADVQE